MPQVKVSALYGEDSHVGKEKTDWGIHALDR